MTSCELRAADSCPCFMPHAHFTWSRFTPFSQGVIRFRDGSAVVRIQIEQLCKFTVPHTNTLDMLLLALGLGRGAPASGCAPPHDHEAWCNASLSAAARAALLVKELTIDELVGSMTGDPPAIARLGVPAYHYGYEALHGLIASCPFHDRCFTSFPCSSASAASFNRTLWFATGSAQIDEVRGMYNEQAPLSPGGSNPPLGMHIRGPQLNPQRDPRWGAGTAAAFDVVCAVLCSHEPMFVSPPCFRSQ